MAFQEELEQHGNWLFQRRSWLPLFLYPAALLAMYCHPEVTHCFMAHDGWGLFCLAVSLMGLLVRALTIGFTPRGTSGRNTAQQVADSLNETGMYSLVRHPLYLGNYLMWLGLLLFTGLWWFVVICSLIYWLYYERIIYAEEAFLRRQYGARYEVWALCTPAFLPRLSGWVAPPLAFSLRNVLNREYNGMFAVVVSLTLLHAISHQLVSEDVGVAALCSVKPLWLVVFTIGSLAFLVLRTLKKNTRLLDIEGR